LFAGKRLSESGEGDRIREFHRDFFLTLAERAEPELTSSEGPAWLTRLEREHDSLRIAFEWSETTEAHESLLRFATALTLFFELRSHLQAGGRWFARALAHDGGPSVLRARALWGAAHVALYGDDYETLGVRAAEASAMAREVGDDRALARILNTNGLVEALVGFEPAAARDMLAQSIALGETCRDNWAIADGWKMLTVAWLVQDDYQGLGPDLAEFRRVAERLDNRFFIAWHHCALGWAAVHQGDLAAAERDLREALAIDRVLGGAATAGIATALLGELESLTGRLDEAGARLRTFVERASATGDGMGLPFAYVALARLLLGQDQPEQARQVLIPLLELLAPLGLPTYVSSGLNVLGAAHLAVGDTTAAETALCEAKRLGASIGNPRLVGQPALQLAELARRRGDADRAQELCHEALALCAPAGVRPYVAESLEALAGLAAQRESPTEAVRLLGAASGMRQSMGLARWPAEQGPHDAMVLGIRQKLGEGGFTAAWEEGGALSPQEAVAYVSRARGERKRPSTGWASLTPTELEVVRLVAQGLTNPQVAERLFVSRGTVKTHLAHVFGKLGLTTRAQLAYEATRRSL
jgi:ATP/maltotriose-dependent transcriptional regulator MalT